jgi:hypothetical protein
MVTKRICKNVIKRKSFTISELHMIYTSSNNVRRPVTKTFITLHYTYNATCFGLTL